MKVVILWYAGVHLLYDTPRVFLIYKKSFMSNEELCPNGHVLGADGSCSRDGYVKPEAIAVEVPAEPVAEEEVVDAPVADEVPPTIPPSEDVVDGATVPADDVPPAEPESVA